MGSVTPCRPWMITAEFDRTCFSTWADVVDVFLHVMQHIVELSHLTANEITHESHERVSGRLVHEKKRS